MHPHLPVHRILRVCGIFALLTAALLCSLPATAANNRVLRAREPNLAILYDQLITELRRGGTAVFFVPLDSIGIDQTNQPEWWKSCNLSRMISAHGMEQAKTINRAISQLELNIQFVESSELCSALSTYTFVLGNDRWLRFFVAPSLNPVEARRASGVIDQVTQAQVLGHLQTTFPDSAKFLFGSPLPPSASPHPIISDLAPGESAIFRSAHNEEPVLLGRLNWQQWGEMGNYFIAKRERAKK
ncbi:MAG: hypothetical protein ING68_01085 [Rhodocyclaceae bacterium]|jgi:hypothetical protein|nr:hypothetical protein [Rhodocyclaceae bacterium]